MSKKLSMDDALIQKLKEILEANLSNENFGVSELATEAGISRSQLHRRLKDSIGKSSSQFIREYRLDRAMEMLKQNSETASEISYKVGFSSPTYFSTTFKNFYGYSPGEVKFQTAIAPPKKTFSKKLAGIIPIIILIGLIVFNEVYNNNLDPSEIEKTIAVLPFSNESDNEENLYFCNGIMTGIQVQLTKIPDIKVVSRSAVEKYLKNPASYNLITEELGVNYIIEGHVQRLGDRAIIYAELIDINNNVLWSEVYDKNVSEIFEVQLTIIQSVTNELKVNISPELNKQLITSPTTDKLAYHYYLRGEEAFGKGFFRQVHKTDVWMGYMNEAKRSYKLAIERDSLFAEAYAGLSASIYVTNKHNTSDTLDIEEVFMYADKSVELNPELLRGYRLRGNYYAATGQRSKAKKEFDRVMELNPNDINTAFYYHEFNEWDNYNFKGDVLDLMNREKTVNSKNALFGIYERYIFLYRVLENKEMIDYYYKKLAEIGYPMYMSFNDATFWSFMQLKRFDEAIEHVEVSYGDNQQKNGYLAMCYMQKKNHIKALEYWKKWHDQITVKGLNSLASYSGYYHYGLCLTREGEKEKGLEMMKKQIDVFKSILNKKHFAHYQTYIYYQSIALYASLGDYDKAHEYINKFEAANGWLYWQGIISYAKFDTQFDSFRQDPKFKAAIIRGEKQIKEVQEMLSSYLPSTPQN